MKRSDLTLLIREIDQVVESAGQLSFQTLYDQQLIQLLIKAKEALIESLSQNNFETEQSEEAPSQAGETEPPNQPLSKSDLSQPWREDLNPLLAAITEAVTTQIQTDKTAWRRSLEAEIASLQQQKQDLLQEITGLERQKKHLIGDFLQVLMERFSDRLQNQISWTCEQIIAQQTQLESTNSEQAEASIASVQNLQQQLESYNQSLAQGLERMYNLAQQSEIKFVQQINSIITKLQQANQLDPAQSHQILRETTERGSQESGTGWNPIPVPKNASIVPVDSSHQSIQMGGITKFKTTSFEAECLQETLSQLQEMVQTQSHQTPIISSLITQPATITLSSSLDQPVAKISSLLELINQPNSSTDSQQLSIWYLAIDFGTSKIAAVLSKAKLDSNNQPQIQQYPIYWLDPSQIEYCSPTLPATVYISDADSEHLTKEVLLENFKPYLNLAISYYEPDQQRWEPLLGNQQQSFSLQQIQSGLTSLLQKFKSSKGIIPQAEGLSSQELHQAIENLEAVIVSCPSQWQDTYSINLREAVLEAGLHKNPAQIFCLPEATASLIDSITAQRLESGLTLVIHIGAANTELALVEIPTQADSININNIKLHTFKYGGNEIDLDIFCNLIYPQWQQQLKTISQLENYKPQAGSSDRARRNLTHLYLQNSAIGRSCLLVAQLSKIVLQQQASFTARLHDQPWTLTRTDFNRQIVTPLIYQLQQQIQFLCQSTQAGELTQSSHIQLAKNATAIQSISTADITQVVCTGGAVACMWQELSVWLSKFLTNARVIYNDPQDPTNQPVARGLGYLPLFPQTLDLAQHRWSDYFLLSELLQAFPARSFELDEIMQLLEAKGINTSICAQRILLLLNGELPPGLIPLDTAYDWLAPISANNPRYQELLAQPLFQKVNNHYRPNYQQCLRVRQYLELIASSSQQQLTAPLLGNISLTAKLP